MNSYWSLFTIPIPLGFYIRERLDINLNTDLIVHPSFIQKTKESLPGLSQFNPDVLPPPNYIYEQLLTLPPAIDCDTAGTALMIRPKQLEFKIEYFHLYRTYIIAAGILFIMVLGLLYYFTTKDTYKRLLIRNQSIIIKIISGITFFILAVSYFFIYTSLLYFLVTIGYSFIYSLWKIFLHIIIQFNHCLMIASNNFFYCQPIFVPDPPTTFSYKLIPFGLYIVIFPLIVIYFFRTRRQ